MKTPMQELIEWMKDNRQFIMLHNHPLLLVQDQCKHLLEKEKQAIMKSYKDGEEYGITTNGDWHTQHPTPEEYYNNTYGK